MNILEIHQHVSTALPETPGEPGAGPTWTGKAPSSNAGQEALLPHEEAIVSDGFTSCNALHPFILKAIRKDVTSDL